MTAESLRDWFDALQADRDLFVRATRKNRGFDRGIWSATVNKYADPAHFVFELLQNAEDEGATHAAFEIHEAEIVFEHNGSDFLPADIENITGIGNTDKPGEANKIGCFGIGFKSVYIVTDCPEVHANIDGEPFAFAISDLVIPERIPYRGSAGLTRFILPLRPDGAEELRAQIRTLLKNTGPRTLLFLSSLREVTWQDGPTRYQYLADDKGNGVRTLSMRIDGELAAPAERYLVFSRDVDRDESKGQLSVKIAYRLDGAGNIVPELQPTKLSVFFETEEQTGLLFHLHGPFELTESRANIKRANSWNDRLADELAALLIRSLPVIRDRGLLKRSFLGVLPNPNDKLPLPWVKLTNAAIDVCREQPLVPAQSGGHARASELVQGPSDIRDFLQDTGLQLFSERPELRWSVSGSQRNQREDNFLTALGIAEWGVGELITALQRAFVYRSDPRAAAWLDGLSDETLQRFYLLLDGTGKYSAIAHLPIVRLENGRRVRAGEARLPPAAEAIDPEVGAGQLRLVRSTLIRGRARETIERFLSRLGVKPVGERDYIAAILARYYGSAGTSPDPGLHARHIRRFLQWWRDHKDPSPFQGTAFLRAEGRDGFLAPSAIYLGAPYSKSGLAAVYDSSIPCRTRAPLWSGYHHLKRDEFIAFLGAVGCEFKLSITPRVIPWDHPHRRELRSGFPYHARETNTGVNCDYTIVGLEHMLQAKDAKIARLIWDTVGAANLTVLKACYTPNQQYAPNYAASSLAIALSSHAWLPDRNGLFRIPSELMAADLVEGFVCRGTEQWLVEIEFGAEHKRRSKQHQERLRAAEIIGLPQDLADRLLELSTEEREQLAQDMIRRIAAGNLGHPEFPERAGRPSDRRTAGLIQRLRTAPAKTYDMRARSTRVSDTNSQVQARLYLSALYENSYRELICQAYHKEMPFRLDNGNPYFEAVEFYSALDVEMQENHLALCPTCAAKWRNANATGPAFLVHAVAEANGPEIEVVLAGFPVQLKFVQFHFDDLKTIISSARDIVAASVASAPPVREEFAAT